MVESPIRNYAALLEDKIAVVSGGGAGIGGGISRLFGSHGATVIVAEIDPERAASTVADIEAAGGRAHAHVVDVRERDQVDVLAERVVADHGRVDVLVNNVGDYLKAMPFGRSDPDHWEALYAINFKHVLLMTHAFLPTMIEHHEGSIINVSSVEGMRGYPADPVYGALKAGVNHFTTCLALEVGRRGIRVNAVGPDLTQTPQVDYHAGLSEEQEKLWEVWAPVGRVGAPDDQADVVLFLASDQSRFVTGHAIPTDGGSLAGGGWYWSPDRRRWVNRPLTP